MAREQGWKCRLENQDGVIEVPPVEEVAGVVTVVVVATEEGVTGPEGQGM